jgi:hypothetical protein
MPLKVELGLVVGKAHFDGRVFVLQQALQFQHGLARQDDLLLAGHVGFQLGLAQRQAVAVGGHQRQLSCLRR